MCWCGAAEALRVRAGLRRKAAKNGKERFVQLSGRPAEALDLHRMHSDTIHPASAWAARIAPSHYRRIFNRAKEAIGVGPEITPHSLCHTFASQLLNCGIEIAHISGQLGHNGVSEKRYAEVDMKTYRHPMEVAKGEWPADLLARLETEALQEQAAGS